MSVHEYKNKKVFYVLAQLQQTWNNEFDHDLNHKNETNKLIILSCQHHAFS